MSLTMDELNKRASVHTKRTVTRLKENYDLARRLGFTGAESVILQSQKRDVIIDLAIERGLIRNSNDPKVA